jgi:hypothetical protein
MKGALRGPPTTGNGSSGVLECRTRALDNNKPIRVDEVVVGWFTNPGCWPGSLGLPAPLWSFPSALLPFSARKVLLWGASLSPLMESPGAE